MSTFPLASNDTLGTLSTQPSTSVSYGTSYSTEKKSDPSAYTGSTLQSAVPAQSNAVTPEALALAMQLLARQGMVLQPVQPETIVLSDGSKYTGPVNKDGKPHGRGVLTYPPANRDALLSYTGEFDNGELHGQGLVKWLSGETFEGFMDRGSRSRGKQTSATGGWYFTGSYKDNQRWHGEEHYKVTSQDGTYWQFAYIREGSKCNSANFCCGKDDCTIL